MDIVGDLRVPTSMCRLQLLLRLGLWILIVIVMEKTKTKILGWLLMMGLKISTKTATKTSLCHLRFDLRLEILPMMKTVGVRATCILRTMVVIILGCLLMTMATMTAMKGTITCCLTKIVEIVEVVIIECLVSVDVFAIWESVLSVGDREG